MQRFLSLALRNDKSAVAVVEQLPDQRRTDYPIKQFVIPKQVALSPGGNMALLMQDQATSVVHFVPSDNSYVTSTKNSSPVRGRLSRIAWEPVGNVDGFAECSTGGTLRVWDISGQLLKRHEAGPSFECSALALSPGARYVAMGSSDGKALLVDTGNEAAPLVLSPGGARVTDLSFEPGLTQLALVRADLTTTVTKLAVKGMISAPTARNPYMSQPDTQQFAPPASTTQAPVVTRPKRVRPGKTGASASKSATSNDGAAVRGPLSATEAVPADVPDSYPPAADPGLGRTETRTGTEKTVEESLPPEPSATLQTEEPAQAPASSSNSALFSKYGGGAAPPADDRAAELKAAMRRKSAAKKFSAGR